MPLPTLRAPFPLAPVAAVLALTAAFAHAALAQTMSDISGEIHDARTKQRIAARVYISSDEGKWYFARSAETAGSAVEYHKERGPGSVEAHTSLSPHPFLATVPAGSYQLTIERGKEYFTHTERVDATRRSAKVIVPLKRWIDMASLGWYSGETHVHRSLDELPTVLQAEDLNVALPLTYWVTQADTPPGRGNKNSPAVDPKIISVDATHVIYPMNTEYEIFTVGGRSHTLGAIFGLNHKEVLPMGAPPVGPIAERVHSEGGLLELDKHNWPWSMMLIPVMKVDLYELTNNHVWRTGFFFSKFGELPPAHWHIEQDNRGFTERGWLDFTWNNYYLLLNCGFRLRPTAGTASGVHPVPLGFGRVYVHLPEGFSYDGWMKGLDAGHSFVTTGPMVDVTFNGQRPGHTFQTDRKNDHCRIQGWIRSAHPLAGIDFISHDGIVRQLPPVNQQLDNGAYETAIDERLTVEGTTWFCVRCIEETTEKRIRFAHTSPVFFDDPEQPLCPRRADVQYLIDRVKAEIARHTGVLSDAALAEYQMALRAYEEIARASRP